MAGLQSLNRSNVFLGLFFFVKKTLHQIFRSDALDYGRELVLRALDQPPLIGSLLGPRYLSRALFGKAFVSLWGACG